MKSSNNNEKKTKKVLCKEAKIYLLKAFLIPQVPMAFIMSFIFKSASNGYKMDVARHGGSPVLGEWNQLEAAISLSTIVILTGVFFLSLALLRVYLSKEYFVRPDSKESTNEK